MLAPQSLEPWPPVCMIAPICSTDNRVGASCTTTCTQRRSVNQYGWLQGPMVSGMKSQKSFFSSLEGGQIEIGTLHSSAIPSFPGPYQAPFRCFFLAPVGPVRVLAFPFFPFPPPVVEPSPWMGGNGVRHSLPKRSPHSPPVRDQGGRKWL